MENILMAIMYLCEFFFCDIANFIGLVIIIAVSRGIKVHYHLKSNKNESE